MRELDAAGVREAGAEAPAQVTDIWHFGSVGKSMTAAMIASLVRQGLLAWAEPLGRRIPEARGTAYERVTLRDLLSHRAGLPTNPPRRALLGYMGLGGDPREVSQKLMRHGLATRPAFPPGSDFLYSNLGYGLAGEVACRATGQGFEDLIRTHVFDRFEMKEARFGVPPQDGSAPSEHVRGLIRRGWKPIRHGPRAVDDLPIIRPSGCISATVSDLMAFARANLLLARASAGRDETLTETHRPVGPPPEPSKEWRYALGWFIDRTSDGGRRLWHAGSTGGSFALMLLLPDDDRGIAVVANAFKLAWSGPGNPVLETLTRWAVRQE